MADIKIIFCLNTFKMNPEIKCFKQCSIIHYLIKTITLWLIIKIPYNSVLYLPV